jgi:hypothetical protein
MRISHLDAVQDASEEWTELYNEYSEGIPQRATRQCAKITFK